ncbi:PLP-dependent aminotransferase family protein [Pseudomonas sp. CCI3.1]|uniref:MocR-like pyridoxine biosynthesis transcription factor PdxR n=1 Tax=Pseudomonas sp. CCI3.1 TaxID=3048618 RepID=UPI002AB36F13|nr:MULTISPECIES: PLP-dependent aminotransferase family protein [unclassified Pseudomonas]MDY7580146.1 PLP-dependent aminotransferase family protein [Pseudomonas sp. CCI3.1]MEB0066275.1 PLP-dependent aminotransferase family protein [Pseudomonas sp. CCI3.1]MEB0071593.1 PLP-dependent aminotransferase family protein [Pseudomonas sp. CCI1.4]
MKTPIPRFSPLDPGSSEPIYRQLYWRFREAIANGVLEPGERVPAARALAKELGLARGTIDAAYSLLTSEGYLQARGQAGTIVTPDIPIQPTAAIRTPDSSPSVRHQPETLPFQMGLPALDAFPKKVWAQIGARCVRSTRAQDMANPSAHGLQSLRTAIATYLQVSRGIACSPAQIFITAGYRDTLSLIAHALLKAGDRVLIEDPGYPPTRQLLEHLHIQTVALPVDHDGLQLPAQGSDALQAQVAVVTPAHQSPLCVSLSLPRRLELLGWASRQQAWIIEDDYDGEYRYVSRPLPALKSLDRDGRVLYSGTFSKVLFPGLRLAYAVVPQEQVERFQQASQIFRSSCPELTQAIVATFMTEGHFARHIQRMRKLYSERRAFTVAGLNKVLGNRVHIDANPGGMHLILRLGNQMTDWELVERMRQDGLFAEALSEWSLLGEKPSGLLLGFANITSQASAEQLGERILALLEPAG